MKKTFTGNTRLFLGISGAIVVIALIMQIVGVGMNLGIDFTGGSILEYSVGEDFDVNDVETLLASVGFEDAQITKAAPSAASEMLQAEIAAGLTEEETEPETHVHEDGTVHAGAEHSDDESEEEVVEEAVEETSSVLSMDKSGIVADGLTDLQIRLTLVDEAEGMEDCIVSAVQGVASGASMTNYQQLTSLSVTENGFDTLYAGGYVVEVDMGGEFDVAAAEEAVNAALAEGGYSINNISFAAYDPAAVEEVVEEEAAEEETSEEETSEEEAVEEVAGTALRVLVDLDDTTSQVRSILEREMSAKYENFHFISIDHVSAIAGRDLLANAVKALLAAFVLMLIYIAIRFDPSSGLAALFALLHDILIMWAFMVFFRGLFQVNSSFIAAILTIVGYSINNTIIIFDRIRENAKLPGNTQKPRLEIVEMSVSSTLSRTANTTITTLIALVCLYIFGVESIREFAFPLIVGMLAGTYSSVLLAGQVWAWLADKFFTKKA